MKKRKKMIKTILAICALTVCACLFTACGSGNAPDGNTENDNVSQGSAASTGDSSGTANLKEVTLLLDWTPNANHAGIYAAQELGYYEDAGLKVNIQVPNDSTSTQLVGVGKAEFGISDTDSVLHAVSLDDPMPVKSIASIIQHNTSGFVSLKEEGIHSPKDWEGKTYGGFGGAAEEKIVRHIAEESGADPDSIRFIMLGNSDTLTSLQNDIDFIWVFEAAELLALDLAGVAYDYLPVRDYGETFDYYAPVLIANNNVCAQDPEMVKAFLAATSKGYEFASEKPEEAADILLKAAPELNEDLIRKGLAYLSERYAADAPQWGWQEADVWKRYADFLYKNELIENEVEAGNVFTTEYLPES
ncbi:MAG: ABC transporter substrate-binding protein [Parasporobacterium sp.]|nr:ABC transporter substrate-binding protein [Parasporobacterium sp.]